MGIGSLGRSQEPPDLRPPARGSGQTSPVLRPKGVREVKDEAITAERIDEVLTIYRSAVDDDPIGFQIKDVSKIWARRGVALLIETDKRRLISVAAILLAAHQVGQRTPLRLKGYMTALRQSFPDLGIPVETFQPFEQVASLEP